MPTRRSFLARSAGALATGGILSLSRAGQATTEHARHGPELISLQGDASQVGRQFGQLNRADLRDHQQQMLASWRSRGLSEKQLIEHSRPMLQFIARFAPAWEDEWVACAQAAELNLDLYVAFQAGKYRDLFFVDECTSFLAVGTATADGAPLFHKNRDNVARPQCAYKKAVAHASKPAAFHATGDTSDMGIMMMLNEHGLAGSADTGGLREQHPKGRGVANPHILRLVAERAERCEDALQIIQQMIRDGWYAGGRKTGTHWHFADRFGKGLRIAQNAQEEVHGFIENDVAFSVRGDTAGAALVLGKKGKITLRDMNLAASHPSICFTSSIAGMTVRIDPQRPADFSSVWFALPACAPYVPLYPLAQGVAQPLLDGDYFRHGAQGRELHNRTLKGPGVAFSPEVEQKRQAIQDQLYADAQQAEQQIREACQQGNNDRARQLASQAASHGCAKALCFQKAFGQR